MYERHGKYRTKVYYTWANMLDRCNNKHNPGYRWYGGRGITVCEEWRVFINFYKDMGDAPKGLTLDRLDSNKGYYKENCRWATIKQQARNKRSSRFITYNGRTLTIAEWAEILNIKANIISYRLCAGWPVKRILN